MRERTFELAVSREELDAERRRLLNLLDHLPHFVCLRASDYSIQFVNRRFRELFGDMNGHKCYESIRELTAPCPDCPFNTVLEDNSPAVRQWSTRSGRTYEVYHYPFQELDGVPRMLKMGIDVTDRIRAERVMELERDKLQSILDAMKDGMYIVNPSYDILFANSALMREFGPPKRHKCYAYLHSRRRPCPGCKTKEVFAGETVRSEWISDKTGKAYELVGTRIRNADGTFSKLQILHDITQRKRAEAALHESAMQMRALSTQLLQAQETERRRISRELHDELGQSLGILKLRLALIRKNLRQESPQVINDCDDTLQYVDQVIENVRRLSRDLSPTILEDLGLGTTLRRLVSQFGQLTNTVVDWRIEDIQGLASRNAEIILYRIFQEALTNVRKHSGAGNLRVILEKHGREIRGLVEDDGAGFDSKQVIDAEPAKVGMGLAIMAERVRMLSGSLDLQSRPGKGTRISFSIPVSDTRVE